MKTFTPKSAAAALALAFLASAGLAQAMTEAQYKAGKEKIAATHKSAKAACASLAGNARDICVAEAAGTQKVARAELEAEKSPGAKSRHGVSVAQAEAAYALAKEKCDDKAGDAGKMCVKEAKAAETRAKAEAKAEMKSATASPPAKPKPTQAADKSTSAGVYVDDAVITGKVKAAVLGEPTLKSAEINVETRKGVVQLSGFVGSKASVDKAVEVARGVEGVKSVKNDMIVKG